MVQNGDVRTLAHPPASDRLLSSYIVTLANTSTSDGVVGRRLFVRFGRTCITRFLESLRTLEGDSQKLALLVAVPARKRNWLSCWAGYIRKSGPTSVSSRAATLLPVVLPLGCDIAFH